MAAASVALVALLAEAGLRLFVGAPPRGNLTPVPEGIREPSEVPGLRYVLRPGAEAVHRFPDDPRGSFDEGATLTYRVNALGLRGPETSRAKPPGVFRILGLGDSFTFGIGVHARDTFLAELGRRLAAVAGPRAFEVLNAGVMGFDTVNEVALLRARGLALQPDLVVICFFLNDAQGGATHSLFNVEEEAGVLAELARGSLLVDRILWSLERRRQSRELVRRYRLSFAPGARGWRRAREALDEAVALAEEEDFELVLVIFPVLWKLSGGYPLAEIHARVGAFGRSRGLPVLDLLPAFAGFEGPELWVHPTNQHPNEKAHAIAGRALFDFLVHEGLVPARDAGGVSVPPPPGASPAASGRASP